MQKLNSLKLPGSLPHEDAIKSFGGNIHSYEPDFWEFQYDIYRYLKNLSEEKLNDRYKDLCRNFRVLTGQERHIIPINSFLSSWYWYRKEHQTRYEFLKREMPIPDLKPKTRAVIEKPFSPRGPNSCDILFRYGELKYMKRIVEQGEIRISPASTYKNGEKFDPRTDDEMIKKRWESGEHVKITRQDGRQMPIIGDLERSIAIDNNYYTLCLSSDFEPFIFELFGYDSCVVIKNPDEFANRLESVTRNILPGWYFLRNPIEYFDPYEPTKNQFFSPTMCKDFKYAYQKEYRFIWDPMNLGNAQQYIEVNLGPLRDICELYVSH